MITRMNWSNKQLNVRSPDEGSRNGPEELVWSIVLNLLLYEMKVSLQNFLEGSRF